jgi:hypothetical protein
MTSNGSGPRPGKLMITDGLWIYASVFKKIPTLWIRPLNPGVYH